ncbi:MAG: U32 family peptidase [Kineosporiaceae bacterium]|nr:U32 family peptidase [Kineosporiaceae bacterium]
MMLLNAPVRSLRMLDLQRRAGAEEVFLGLQPPPATGMSLDSLPVIRDGQPTQVGSVSMLTALIREAHQHGMRANFCADAPVVPAAVLPAWLDHVRTAVDAGADAIVVGSLGAATRAGTVVSGTTCTLTAGSMMAVAAPPLIDLLTRQLGVRRIAVPQHLTLDELRTVRGQVEVELEVHVQTGSGWDCTRCSLPDQPGVGLACRAGYRTDAGWVDAGAGPGLLDGGLDCALCDLPALMQLGVDVVTIAGRESPNLRQNAKVTQIYRRALDGLRAGRTMPEIIADIDRVELSWQMAWIPRLCDQRRCRFRDSPISAAFV